MEQDKERLKELIEKVSQGNPTATYNLLYKEYKNSLVKVISKIKRCTNEIQLEIVLSDFYFYLLTPTKRDHRVRLEKLDVNSNIESYLNNILRNWLIEQLRKEQLHAKKTISIEKDVATTSTIDEGDLGAKTKIEQKLWALIRALECVPTLKTKDRYILLTYIMGEQYKGCGGPLHISRFLSNQLGMSEAAIKMRYKRNLERLREEAEKYL